ncbi:protein disulfide isomerase [Pelomyxa schiedti]|nr:protein disulfide isomerase [Pelomyxa schiedti]
MVTRGALFAGLCVLSLTLALEAPILDLTDATFATAIREHPIIFVEFYAPWCGHCQQLAPEYNLLAWAFEGDDVTIARVDAVANQEVATSQQIDHYPILRLFKDGIPVDYNGERTAEAMVSFVERARGPGVVQLASMDEANDFIQKSKTPVVIAFFDSSEGEDYKSFMRWVGSYHLNSAYAHAVIVGAVPPQFTTPAPFIALLDPALSETGSWLVKNTLPLEVPIDFQAVDKWLITESLPPLAEIGPQTYAKYITTGLPIAWLVLNPEADNNATIELVAGIAAEYKHKIVFLWLDSKKFTKQVQMLAVASHHLPAFVLTNGMLRFTMEDTESIDKSMLTTFVDSFLSGNLKPTILSQPIPTTNDGPVFTIVGNTFNEVVDDPTRDVLVKFYVPWCGHCQALAPIYEQLGEWAKPVPTLRIAEIDASANDIPNNLPVSGYPTLLLFRASNKDPLSYDGSRTLEDMVDFLKENSQPFAWEQLELPKTEDEEDDEDDAAPNARYEL